MISLRAPIRNSLTPAVCEVSNGTDAFVSDLTPTESKTRNVLSLHDGFRGYARVYFLLRRNAATCSCRVTKNMRFRSDFQTSTPISAAY